MKLHIVTIGQVRKGPEREMVDDYIARFERTGRQIGFRGLIEHELSSGGGEDAEAERLLARCPYGARIAMLDERGKTWGSEAFSGWLGELRDGGERDLCFLIGGAAGHGQAVRAAAQHKLAFGPQTWPHKLVRVMLAEQLYRAATLLAGTPYHKV
ncbi:MAG: 23S rRNA (pseudouridine(1915)-N(3))-methyltransferase RlmH [Hyphomonadaceae bacterium]|nr:23S rRNA (pseudouridine(1915)-N(3))-methyltransferase RlmH [Hyphomonadaceae bacterium]